MSKRSKKKDKSKLIMAVVLVAVLAVLAVLLVTDHYMCPFKFITGIPCPACGMTRACLAVAHGDFPASFYYHPLWPVIVPTVLAEILDGFGIIRIPPKFNNIWLCIAGVLLLVCYIVRMATNTLVY